MARQLKPLFVYGAIVFVLMLPVVMLSRDGGKWKRTRPAETHWKRPLLRTGMSIRMGGCGLAAGSNGATGRAACTVQTVSNGLIKSLANGSSG